MRLSGNTAVLQPADESGADLNASVNILRQGIASSGSTHKTVLARQGASATGESPLL